MFKFEKKVLDNGLRVITVPMENTEAVTLMVLIGVGSRYETKNINGISHFLEHLFFKGSKSRPNPGDVSRELDRIGAFYNAFTSKELTGFFVKSAAKDFDISLDIVSDILIEPLFNAEEIEKERGVILQEINMYEDEPRQKIADILENVIYGDQPVGWGVLGEKENIISIKREDIVDYKNNNYISENIVVAVAGNINKEEVLKKVEDAFKNIAKGKSKPANIADVIQDSTRIKIVKKDTDQTHLTLAIRSFDMFNEKKYALNLLSVILGGNMSSKLFREIRDKLGLAYYTYAWKDEYTDCGYLGIGAGIPHDKLEVVVNKIIGILGEIKEKGVSLDDLEHAKGFIRGNFALRFESSDALASFAAEKELFFNEVMQPSEIIEKIEKVSQDDILILVRDLFKPENISMAVIGQNEDSKENVDLYTNIFNKI